SSSVRAAVGVGLATVTPQGQVLDVWFPRPSLVQDGHFAEQPDLSAAERVDALRDVEIKVVRVEIADLAQPPVDTADAYLRLHLLSARLVLPRSINLDGVFGLLPNNAWTDQGAVPV